MRWRVRALGTHTILCLVGAVWALLLLASLAGPTASLARFTSSSSVGANTFTTASCFPNNTGLLNPSANSADSGGNGDGYELNPTNAYADGGGNATDAASNGDRHRYFNYNISIPAGCSIKGIVVRLDWWLNTATGTNSISVGLSWNASANYTALKTDNTMTTTEHTTLLGNATDTWGRAWAISEFTNANFRVRLTDNTTNGRTFNLDWVPVQIYYGP